MQMSVVMSDNREGDMANTPEIVYYCCYFALRLIETMSICHPETVPVGLTASELIRCINFAAIKHKDQRRKDPEKTPYINHPIGVAHILTFEANVTDVPVLQAALLHDTVEDTNTTHEELVSEFGEDVAGLVAEVTDDKSLHRDERKMQQILHAPHASPRAKLIKLADKLYNLRDLIRCTPNGWSEQRVQEYFEWAAKVVEGLRGSNQPMESELDKIFEKRGILQLPH